MAYTDLITFDDLQALDFNGERLLDTVTDQTEVEQVITEESSRITDWLNTAIIATSFTQVVQKDEWHLNEAYDTDPYEAYLQHTPVTEVLTDDYSARRDYFVASDSSNAEVIEYVAGYLRPDQTLSDLQGEVADATVAPGTIPRQIQSACARLVAYRLIESKNNLQGRTQVDQGIGSQGNVVTSMQADFMQRVLNELTTFRRRV